MYILPPAMILLLRPFASLFSPRTSNATIASSVALLAPPLPLEQFS